MESAQDWHSAKALLEWHMELGAIDAVGDAPIDRYALDPSPAVKPKATAPENPNQPPQKRKTPPTPVVAEQIDYVALAKQIAAGAKDLDGLRAAIKAFDGCELKRGARNTIMGTGNPAARVMIITDAPGRQEDIQGIPMTGPNATLLDKMFNAIGMGIDAALSKDALYITNILPWPIPQDRDPSLDDLAVMLPFVERHVQLVAPEIIILMGNAPCHAILGRNSALRLRGTWNETWGKPTIAMTHPNYLLKNPIAKREAWADLQSLQAKLNNQP
jgi:DNA polymerase